MFSGQVSEIGTISAPAGTSGLLVAAPKAAGRLEGGGSVAVNGVRLSVTDVGAGTFRAALSQETLHPGHVFPLAAREGGLPSGPGTPRPG